MLCIPSLCFVPSFLVPCGYSRSYPAMIIHLSALPDSSDLAVSMSIPGLTSLRRTIPQTLDSLSQKESCQYRAGCHRLHDG